MANMFRRDDVPAKKETAANSPKAQELRRALADAHEWVASFQRHANDLCGANARQRYVAAERTFIDILLAVNKARAAFAERAAELEKEAV